MASKQTKADEVQMISLSELKPFEDAPFKVRFDDNMNELIESVKDSGVLVPLIARPHAEGGYEILAGHRRAEASKLANFEKVPVIVKDVDDDTAVILLVDSNLHRDDILPSEKALAYQMKMEALSNQGKRNDLTCGQIVHKSENTKTRDEIGVESGESGRQIQRYLRLNNLIDPILKMVDEKKLPVNAAVELSYLGSKEQVDLFNTIEAEETTPKIEQAREIRRKADEGKFSVELVETILRTEKPETIKISFEGDKLKKYFPNNYSKKQIEDAVLKILENWHQKQIRKRNQMER
ncbi:MAG: ParB/RepB/Spo0J family partition protein [Clostridia bacterium]|nr:ParB/RepB/Spo0J family partition protein [Clostridia bacterium]